MVVAGAATVVVAVAFETLLALPVATCGAGVVEAAVAAVPADGSATGMVMVDEAAGIALAAAGTAVSDQTA